MLPATAKYNMMYMYNKIKHVVWHEWDKTGPPYLLRGLDRLKGTKILFKYGEERSIVCDCTYEEKTIFLGFTQNGCYGNQPHPSEALI